MNDSMGFFNRMFDYRDGKLIQKVKRPRVNVGDIAGTKDTSGHLQTMVYGRLYLVHRIIWIMLNGDIPDKMEIDHINGVRDDNRIENLRLVTKVKTKEIRSLEKTAAVESQELVFISKRVNGLPALMSMGNEKD